MPTSRTASGLILVSDTTGTAGTAKRLHSVASTGTLEDWRAQSVTIIAKPSNATRIHLGGSGLASGSNYGLSPGDSVEFSPSPGRFINLTEIFFIVRTTGDGLDYYAVTA